MHRVAFTIAAIFWGIATLALLVGSIMGAIKGQWRFLAPGFVLYHMANFVIRWVI